MTFRRTRCAHCRQKFAPERPSQIVHVECVEAWTEAQAAKRERAEAKVARSAAKVERAETRIRKEAIKRKPDLMREADQAFAAYIRERDRQAGHPCISSGRPLDWASGNQVDAGHYRSRGAASHLRYHPDNCHAQSKYENRHRAGNAVEYRAGLIARIGLVAVEALEADNRVHHWTHDELRQVRDTYRQKLKQLTKGTP